MGMGKGCERNLAKNKIVKNAKNVVFGLYSPCTKHSHDAEFFVWKI